MTKVMVKQYEMVDHDVIVGEAETPYVLRVRDLPIEEKPREKLAQLGPGSLSMAELVAVLWGVGTTREDVLAMSRRVLREYGEKALLHQTNPTKLAEALQIPVGKAGQIIVSLELGRRFYERRAGRAVFVHTAKAAFDYLKDMGSMKKEQLRGLYLNSRYQVIHEEIISVGSLTANIVHPREVFQPAIEHGAVAVIIAHNHPSGSLKPTDADQLVTEQLAEAGKILGIELLDHLIIVPEKYVSIIGGDV